MVHNFCLIWLDKTIDENQDDNCRKLIQQLQKVTNNLHTFNNVKKCVDFITTNTEDKIAIILSDIIALSTVPLVHDNIHVCSIYIFSNKKKIQHKQWMDRWTKLENIYTDIDELCVALNGSKNQYEIEETNIEMDTYDNISNKSFQSKCMAKQTILDECYTPEHLRAFVNHCQSKYDGMADQLKVVEQVKSEYLERETLWWYTRRGLLFSELTAALNTANMNHMKIVGFFISDLYHRIKELHGEQFRVKSHLPPMTFYREWMLPENVFRKLFESKPGILLFRNFLNATQSEKNALNHVQHNIENSNDIGILFVINVKSPISSIPFADITDFIEKDEEKEILFTFHSVFHIKKIERINANDRLWRINLNISKNKGSLWNSVKHNKNENKSSHDSQRFDAQEFVKKLQSDDENTEFAKFFMKEVAANVQGLMNFCQCNVKVVISNEKGVSTHVPSNDQIEQEIKKFMNKNNPVNAEIKKKRSKTCHNTPRTTTKEQLTSTTQLLTKNQPDTTILCAKDDLEEGTVHMEHKKQNTEDLCSSIVEADAVQIVDLTNHSDPPILNNNIGKIYDALSDDLNALLCCQKDLELKLKTTPANSPNLLVLCINIARMYERRADIKQALLHYEKVLDILQIIPLEDCIESAGLFNRIGGLYYTTSEYSKALVIYQKVVDINEKILDSNHPDFATSYNDLGLIYETLSEDTKALSYYEKAIDIYQEMLDWDHPYLATAYNNIGLLYNKMGLYVKALDYHKKALEIREKLQPQDDIQLSNSYTSMGVVLTNLEQYDEALFYHEKALDQLLMTQSSTETFQAIIYNNIGIVYKKMSQYDEALEYFEADFKISNKILPENHFNLAICFSNLGGIYYNMKNYSEALSYSQKALEIKLKILSSRHLELARSYNNLGLVYDAMGEDSKGLHLYKQALDIIQHTLPANHPDRDIYNEHLQKT